MLSKLIGYFSIFLGALWILWPQLLRGWLVLKTSRTIFWALYILLFLPLAAWAGQWGWRGWVATVIGLLVLGRMLRTLIGRAAVKIPMEYFRAAGLLNIISGLWLVLSL